ncbi:MAG: hypothetical protein AB1421_08470 [Pseudomonadota bacterium]
MKTRLMLLPFLLASAPALATIAAPIPEPKGLSLLGIGAAALTVAYLRGRRNK